MILSRSFTLVEALSFFLPFFKATQSSMATAQEQHFQELAELREKYCTLKQFVADSNLQLHKLHDQESSSVRSSSVSTQCGTEVVFKPAAIEYQK